MRLTPELYQPFVQFTVALYVSPQSGSDCLRRSEYIHSILRTESWSSHFRRWKEAEKSSKRWRSSQGKRNKVFQGEWSILSVLLRIQVKKNCHWTWQSHCHWQHWWILTECSGWVSSWVERLEVRKQRRTEMALFMSFIQEGREMVWQPEWVWVKQECWRWDIKNIIWSTSSGLLGVPTCLVRALQIELVWNFSFPSSHHLWSSPVILISVP